MKPRRLLTTREHLAIFGDPRIDAARFVTTTSIPLGGGREPIAPGADVTEEARAWPTLAAHVKRGTIRVVFPAETLAPVEPERSRRRRAS